MSISGLEVRIVVSAPLSIDVLLLGYLLAIATQAILFIILLYIYRKCGLISALYFALTFMGLIIFTASNLFEKIYGLNNFIFFIGSSSGVTGAFFSLLFWETARTRNYLNKESLIGSILYGLSIGTLLLYCVKRPYWATGRMFSGVMQLIFYTYISAIAIHVVYLMNKFSKHELIKKQVIIFTIVAIISYGSTNLFILLTIPDVIDWRYVFLVYTAITTLIMIIYVKNPLLFVYLPEALYELKGLSLEKVMLTTLNGALIWSSGEKEIIKRGLEDELVSNLIAALEMFGEETLNIKPKLNVLSLRINDKILFIKRYRELQCVLIANNLPKALKSSVESYLIKAYPIVTQEELPKVSKRTIDLLDSLYKKEFRYFLMLEERSKKE